MAFCTACGRKLGFFEHVDDKGRCAGCHATLEALTIDEARASMLKPYENGALPTIYVKDAIMKAGDVAHAIADATLNEVKTVDLGYRGASHGVSIPLPIKVGGFPVRYRVGQSRGRLVKKDELKQTSSGHLIATSQRLFLNPIAGSKPLSIDLKKIASFHVYEDGLEIWEGNKEHPYLFGLDSTHAEIMGLCLSQLLNLEAV